SLSPSSTQLLSLSSTQWLPLIHIANNPFSQVTQPFFYLVVFPSFIHIFCHHGHPNISVTWSTKKGYYEHIQIYESFTNVSFFKYQIFLLSYFFQIQNLSSLKENQEFSEIFGNDSHVFPSRYY
ncbi:hypothetical protein CAEBREN_15516, partial [Caenorhabditis brenneri]